MRGVTKIVDPKLVQMSPKLNVSLLNSMKKGGAWIGGRPEVMFPIDSIKKKWRWKSGKTIALIYQLTGKNERIVFNGNVGIGEAVSNNRTDNDDDAITRGRNKPQGAVKNLLPSGPFVFFAQFDSVQYAQEEKGNNTRKAHDSVPRSSLSNVLKHSLPRIDESISVKLQSEKWLDLGRCDGESGCCSESGNDRSGYKLNEETEIE